MITYAWRTELADNELADVESLLEHAVEYDAEAGFSTATPTTADRGEVRHLLVSIAPPGERGSVALDRLPDVPVVAYLRLDVRGEIADVQLVVRPEFRSHGIATLLAELLDEQPTGWSSVEGVRRLRAWAHGAHPAAERMARRFGARVDHALFKTLRFIGGSRPFVGEDLKPAVEPDLDGPDETVEGHLAAMAPGERSVLARARTRLVAPAGSVLVGVDEKDPAGHPACIAVDTAGVAADDLRALLATALLRVQADGARVAQMYVDALSEAFVGASRALGFQHDQSDLLYVRAL
ncbi:hypothetical protein ABT304_01920 [Nocardioides sp. NPDC000445]|uniref:GNAT family N-acetyltransferase n=1 Tax=Nocardioides sp. NPDC000445 TaxID=3154257 RepID=UPI00332566D5